MALADTSFFIDLLNGEPGAKEKLDELIELGEPLWVPAIALHELYYGAYLHANAEEEEQRIRELERALPPVGFSPGAARIAGDLEARQERRGDRTGRADLQIAAIALHRSEPLIARDGDYDGIDGLRVEEY